VHGGEHDVEFGAIGDERGPAKRCPQCGDLVGSLTWPPPYRGELELYGKDYSDLVEGPSDGLVATERFVRDFKSEGLTGLSGFHPVEVTRVRRGRRGPKPGPPPRYLYVNVVHGPAALDLERSRLNRHNPRACTWCREAGVDAIDGLVLEVDTWGGEDIFRPRGLDGVMLVSERFARFAEKHAMTNMALVPAEKYVWDPLCIFHPWSTQQPPTKG
jgi:hypothetical protein